MVFPEIDAIGSVPFRPLKSNPLMGEVVLIPILPFVLRIISPVVVVSPRVRVCLFDVAILPSAVRYRPPPEAEREAVVIPELTFITANLADAVDCVWEPIMRSRVLFLGTIAPFCCTHAISELVATELQFSPPDPSVTKAKPFVP